MYEPKVDISMTIKQYLLPALEETGDIEEFIEAVKILMELKKNQNERA